ncbi:MAG: GDSL-type esterase/lipase family protein [Verrucomicrobiota bacterium]|nr:GDSL-type esterase/lipase family protein [Verrucomicrobiota bacterium]
MNGKTFSAFLLVLSLFGCSWFVHAKSVKGPKRVACVGDSITFGAAIKDRAKNCYPAQLGRILGEGWDVANFGVNGATLLKKGDKPYWKQRAFGQAHAFEPDVVIIKLGTNDSKPRNWKHRDDYVSDYLSLIEGFRKLESKPEVFICYPAPAYPGRWGITDKVMKEEVMPRLDEVSKKSGCKVIDLYAALSGKKEMFPDLVHPNAEGATVMAKIVAATIIGKRK